MQVVDGGPLEVQAPLMEAAWQRRGGALVVPGADRMDWAAARAVFGA